jgi:UDPglucose 6-dehydrogenase
VALWGLAFKAGTDDIRESPAIPLVEGLLQRGAQVTAHDPHAAANARERFGARIEIAADPYEALSGADALVIVTEWLQYRTPNFDRMRQLLRRPLIIDGRNLFEPERLRRYGFAYTCVGRPAS